MRPLNRLTPAEAPKYHPRRQIHCRCGHALVGSRDLYCAEPGCGAIVCPVSGACNCCPGGLPGWVAPAERDEETSAIPF